VLLQRVPRADGERIWKVSSATIDAVPRLYDEFGYGQLGEILPQFFFEVRFLEIQLWQWLGLFVLLTLAALLSWLGTVVIVRIVTPILKRSGGAVDVAMVHHVLTPFRVGAMVLLFSAFRNVLKLAKPVDLSLDAIEMALLIIAATWILLRGVDAIGDRIAGRLATRGQFGVMPLVRPARRGVKLLVVLFASIVALDNFGFNVTALVAGLGVGGIAVALAAQKSLENLFGAITLFSDQPVRVGDFCGFDGRVGTVEEIGLRSTRIRTNDRTIVAIPNADFAGMKLENYSARDKIWYHPTIGLRYETTPEQIRYILVEVRRMLYAHPRVDPDPARIRFVSFGAYSLDFEIFAYVRTRDFGEFLEIAEDLNLRVMDIVAEAGTGFAFPSQTTYVETGEGVDRERGKAAEDEVRSWRERGELYIPSFPRAEIGRLQASLDYPPEGSPARAAGNGTGRR
jgi:MscS family membrane protein